MFLFSYTIYIGIQYLTQKQNSGGNGEGAMATSSSVGNNLDLALNRPARTTRSLAVHRALSLANMGSDADDENEVEKETLNMMNEATNFMGG